MRVSIEHGNTKREINGAFNICGSAEDLRAIAMQIIAKCDDSGMAYGWVNIMPLQKPQRSITDTPPKKWED